MLFILIDYSNNVYASSRERYSHAVNIFTAVSGHSTCSIVYQYHCSIMYTIQYEHTIFYAGCNLTV